MNIKHYKNSYSYSSVSERLPNGEIDVNIEVNDNGNRKHNHFIIDNVGNIINEDIDEYKETLYSYPDDWNVKMMDTGTFRCVKPYDKNTSDKKQRIDSCDTTGSYYYKKGMPEDGYENKQLCVEQCHLGKRNSNNKNKNRRKKSYRKVHIHTKNKRTQGNKQINK